MKNEFNQEESEEMEKLDEIPVGEKLCPLMNGFYKKILCGSYCAFYRANKKDSECIFNELQSISYFLKKLSENKNNPNNKQ